MGAATRIVGLVGWPVTHSFSPAMQDAAFAAAGLDLRYCAFPVEPARLGEAIAGAAALGFAGLNVTVPHKVAALALCDPDDEARRAGAVNTLVFDPAGGDDGRARPRGLNTDVHGFSMLLDEAAIDPTGRRVVVLGAGGAARAVVLALAARGAASIDLVARRPAPLSIGGRTLTPSPWTGDVLAPLLSRCDLLVDATPRGLPSAPAAEGDAIDLTRLPAGAAVVDIAVRSTTPLVDAARACGLRASTGEAMLLHQGARAFTAWTGHPAPVEAMRAALAAAIAESARAR